MIGMNIKLFRQQKHVKQETLADYLGVSSQAVSKWETGTSDPDVVVPEMKKRMEDAGIYEVVEDIQQQLNEWLA